MGYIVVTPPSTTYSGGGYSGGRRLAVTQAPLREKKENGGQFY